MHTFFFFIKQRNQANCLKSEKNIITVLLLIICGSSFGQQLTVTPFGLRNAEDTAKTFVIVEMKNLSAKQLYDRAFKFISDNSPNPELTIKNKIDSAGFDFDTYVPEFLMYNNTGAQIQIEAYYTTELKFYDGKFSYEIISLQMNGAGTHYKVMFTGGFLQGYIIYNRKGKLFKPRTKYDIENYFNLQISKIVSALNNEQK